jgi:tRNA A-37 threonylcarbamoyl transferase component Bud32
LRVVVTDNCIVRVHWVGDLRSLGDRAEGVREGRFSDLDRYLESEGTVLRGSGANLVAEIPLGEGTRAVVKRFGWRKRWHRWFSPFKRSKAVRSFLAARRLLELGIRTPEPLLAIEFRRSGFVRANYFFTEFLGPARNSRVLLRETDRPEEIVREIARIVRRMHEGGLCHRDLTLANFLRREGEAGLYVIDLNRARVRRRIGGLERLEDIARIDLRSEHLETFLKEYLGTPRVGSRSRLISLRRRVRAFRRRLRGR